jgi:hypothetical protein
MLECWCDGCEASYCRRWHNKTCEPEPEGLGVQVMRSAIGHAHMQRHVLAVEHLCNGAFHGFHQLGSDTHLAVAAEDCEGSHVTGRIVRFVGPVNGEREGE